MPEIAQQFARRIRALYVTLAVSALLALALTEFFGLGVKGLLFMGFATLAGIVIGVAEALFSALHGAIHITRQDRQ